MKFQSENEFSLAQIITVFNKYNYPSHIYHLTDLDEQQ